MFPGCKPDPNPGAKRTGTSTENISPLTPIHNFSVLGPVDQPEGAES